MHILITHKNFFSFKLDYLKDNREPERNDLRG